MPEYSIETLMQNYRYPYSTVEFYDLSLSSRNRAAWHQLFLHSMPSVLFLYLCLKVLFWVAVLSNWVFLLCLCIPQLLNSSL
jgi:hypothetical protein